MIERYIAPRRRAHRGLTVVSRSQFGRFADVIKPVDDNRPQPIGTFVSRSKDSDFSVTVAVLVTGDHVLDLVFETLGHVFGLVQKITHLSSSRRTRHATVEHYGSPCRTDLGRRGGGCEIKLDVGLQCPLKCGSARRAIPTSEISASIAGIDLRPPTRKLRPARRLRRRRLRRWSLNRHFGDRRTTIRHRASRVSRRLGSRAGSTVRGDARSVRDTV